MNSSFVKNINNFINNDVEYLEGYVNNEGQILEHVVKIPFLGYIKVQTIDDTYSCPLVKSNFKDMDVLDDRYNLYIIWRDLNDKPISEFRIHKYLGHDMSKKIKYNLETGDIEYIKISEGSNNEY